MMFRHHKDPLYYDTNANSKIFVPIDPLAELGEKQLQIIESFPAEDRGLILSNEEYSKKGYGLQNDNIIPGQGGNLTGMIEADQFEAAAKRHKLKEAMQKEKRLRKIRDKKGEIQYKKGSNSEDSSDESNDNPYDSEEREYGRAAKADVRLEMGEEEEEHGENSYDSELEQEFYGKKDPH